MTKVQNVNTSARDMSTYKHGPFHVFGPLPVDTAELLHQALTGGGFCDLDEKVPRLV